MCIKANALFFMIIIKANFDAEYWKGEVDIVHAGNDDSDFRGDVAAEMVGFSYTTTVALSKKQSRVNDAKFAELDT